MATGDPPVAASGEQVTGAPQAPPAQTAIQPPAEGDPGRIPLPPLAPAPAAAVSEGLARRVRLLDGVLVLLLLVFAFLVASFRAANADVFLHLATGRLIAEGYYTIGQDPFAFTSSGRWVHHAWLYDLAMYLVYSLGEWGGVALVVLKGLAVVATAW